VKSGSSIMVATFLHPPTALVQPEVIEIESSDSSRIRINDYTERNLDFVDGSNLSIDELRNDWIEEINKGKVYLPALVFIGSSKFNLASCF
jgi:hypothetical protein